MTTERQPVLRLVGVSKLYGNVKAVDNISLDVQEGEAVGVIGRNGAGKSTLLKILSRITPPTSGTVDLRGHVGSLLEVGTGFHPELTGLENVYLNGAILGMSQRDLEEKFEKIDGRLNDLEKSQSTFREEIKVDISEIKTMLVFIREKLK